CCRTLARGALRVRPEESAQRPTRPGRGQSRVGRIIEQGGALGQGVPRIPEAQRALAGVVKSGRNLLESSRGRERACVRGSAAAEVARACFDLYRLGRQGTVRRALCGVVAGGARARV